MYPEDFLRLLVNSTAIVGNSSVAIRECAFLGVPAVNIGSRQQGRERGGNVIDVEHDRAAIADGIRQHLKRGKAPSDHLYGDGRGAGDAASPSAWRHARAADRSRKRARPTDATTMQTVDLRRS